MSRKKKLLLAFLATVSLIIVFWIGYSSGYSRGSQDSFFDGYREGQKVVPIQHHYEFKQHGASIFRFDPDTGESCWVQLSSEDAKVEDALTSPMTQCAPQ